MKKAIMKEDLRALLGVKLPLIQAPMAGVQGSRLAIAVGQAGALGSLPCAMLGADALRTELQALQAGLPDLPWNLNFFCHTPPTADAQRESAWRAALTPYFAEHGIDAASIAAGPGRNPFSAAMVDLIEPFAPRVLSFHFGLPDAALLQRVKAWGARVLASATTVQEGLWLQAHGADAVIAQGLEAGGHRGHFLDHDLTRQMGVFALVPQLVAALRVPVIAAGGIADAQGVAAALALGADGVQVGTAFMLSDEASTSALHRAALQSEDARHTALTTLFTGRPARGIVNRVMRELGPLNPAAPEFPLATSAIAPLRAKAEAVGKSDFTPLWSGQNAAACRPQPAAQLVQALARGLRA